MLLSLILGGLVTVALAACTVGPDFVKPAPKMPERWAEAPPHETTIKSLDISRWWTIFGDPKLDSLIERAVQANLDLQLGRRPYS